MDLREYSCKELIKINFEGYALGGLAVGEAQGEMFSIIENTEIYLPKDKPRYLMGVGKPDDIIGAIKRGIDMFDCVLPTRSGRNGQLSLLKDLKISKIQNLNLITDLLMKIVNVMYVEIFPKHIYII